MCFFTPQQLGLDVVTQTSAIGARYLAHSLGNFSDFEATGFEAFALATLSSLSGLSSILAARAVPRERRSEFEDAARLAGAANERRYGER